jgi:aldose sugar dehydrogenase
VRSLGHYGSRIAFDGRGYVFVTVGERHQMERAQRLGEHNGKVVRLFDDGRVPPDNPFVGRAGALPAIWALGIRSPQGLAFQPGTGRLYECEHGPMGGDEINIIQRGRNYGWPIITWGRDYDGSPIGVGPRRAGLEQPIKYWTPSIAPSGISFYDGGLFPAWRGNLFVAALKYRMVVRLVLTAAGTGVAREERFLQDRIGRVRHVKPGRDGKLYVLTDEADGAVWTLEPVA